MKFFSLANAKRCLVGFAFLSIPCLGGVVFQAETTYHFGSPGVESSEMMVDVPNLKVEIPSGRRDGKVHKELIYRGDRDEVYVVDHDKREVVVVESPLVGKGLPNEADRTELYKHMTPEQREKFEAELKKMVEQNRQRDLGKLRRQKVLRWQERQARKAPPAIARKSAGETQLKATAGEQASDGVGLETIEIAGYECQKYKVHTDGMDNEMYMWTTREIRLERPKSAAVVDNLGSFYRDLKRDRKRRSLFDALFDDGPNPLEEFLAEAGFRIMTKSFEGGELESETVLESVSERDLDPDAFEPPKGYRLRTMGGFFQ